MDDDEPKEILQDEAIDIAQAAQDIAIAASDTADDAAITADELQTEIAEIKKDETGEDEKWLQMTKETEALKIQVETLTAELESMKVSSFLMTPERLTEITKELEALKIQSQENADGLLASREAQEKLTIPSTVPEMLDNPVETVEAALVASPEQLSEAVQSQSPPRHQGRKYRVV